MNYHHFFNDVANWIELCNGKAKQFGMNSTEFWDWTSESLAKLCEKYNNHDLVQNQTFMLWNWIQSKVEEKQTHK